MSRRTHQNMGPDVRLTWSCKRIDSIYFSMATQNSEVTAASVGIAPGLFCALNPELSVLLEMLLAASFVAVATPLLLLSSNIMHAISRSHYSSFVFKSGS